MILDFSVSLVSIPTLFFFACESDSEDDLPVDLAN